MVGRGTELEQLVAELATAASGAGRCTLIEGEPGIGKSRLVSEALGSIPELGLTVLVTEVNEFERDRPFGPLLQAFPLPAELPSPGEGERTWRMVDAVVDAVERSTARSPLALVVENVHWADAPTLRTLQVLVRRVPSLPAALVLTRRPSPTSPEVDAVVRTLVGAGGRRIHLGPLDQSEVALLASAALGDAADASALAYLDQAAGNPFLVTGLVEAVAGRHGGAPPATSDVQDAYLARLGALGSGPRWLARTASVLGNRFSVAELAAVAGATSAQLLSPLEELVANGFLREDRGGFAFRHDLTRAALYETIPGPVRSGVHRDVAAVLIERGASAVEVARHLVEGAEPGDTASVAWLRRAAEEAAVHAPGVGADLLARAASLLPLAAGERRSLDAERAQLLGWSGRLAEGEALARSLLESGATDPMARSSHLATLGECLFFQGRVAEAAVVFESAAELAGPDRALRLAEAALAGGVGGGLDRAVELCTLAETEGAACGDSAAVALGLAVRSQVFGIRGQIEAVDLARRGVEVAAADPGRTHRYGPSLFLGTALTEVDAEDAEHVLRRGLALDEEQGTGWGAPVYHFFLGAQQVSVGAWDNAVAEIRTGLDLAEDTGLRVMSPYAYGWLAHVAVHRDDLDAARVALDAGGGLIAELGPQLGLELLTWSSALVLEASGDLEAAVAVLGQAWAVARAAGARLVCRIYGPDLTRLAVATGQRELVADVVAETAAAAAAVGTPTYTGVARRCRGLAEDDVAILEDAVAALRRSPRVVELAWACEDAGMALVREERRDDGLDLLDEALGTFEAVGAVRDAARVSSALRRAGRQRRGAPSHGMDGWDALSPTERSVVALVAGGSSNREAADRLFLSRRTVDNHLYRVFTKLGVSNRVELSLRVRAWGPRQAD